jgi:hypothetical protein
MPMAKFEPTDEQREDVAIKATGRFSQEEIATSVINPRTGRRISVKTLCRVFKRGLSNNVEFKKLILQKFQEEVNAGNWQAIKYGMDYVVGFADGTATAKATTSGSDAMAKDITVRFVPPPHSNEPPPIDITPRPALPWPESASHCPPAELDSTDPMFHRPLAQETHPDPQSPADAVDLLFKPLHGKYATEFDVPGEHSKPWHKRKLTGRLAKGSNECLGKMPK